MITRRGLLAGALLMAGLFPVDGAGAAGEALYFSSAEDSVPRITELMRAQDWPTLARYYDLAGSGVARGELESGTFFLRTDPPENAHPGGLWKFREPFAPGFTFISAEPPGPTGTVEVLVGIAIDEGGGMVQRGRTSFQLRRTAAGYQLRPAILAKIEAMVARDPAYAATGGISRFEAAEKAGVDDSHESWHAVYCAALNTWFFTSAHGPPVALERVPVANPPLPPKAPPGFEPKPWKWTARALPAMDVTATDEIAHGTGGATRFRRPLGGFDDLLPSAADEFDVPAEKIWAWLDRAREKKLRVQVSVADPASPGAHAVLKLMPAVQ